MSLNQRLEKIAKGDNRRSSLTKLAAEGMRKIAGEIAHENFEKNVETLYLIKQAKEAYPTLKSEDKIEAEKAISYGAGYARGEQDAFEKMASSIDEKSFNAGVAYVMGKVAEAYGQPVAKELGGYIEQQEAPAVAEEEDALMAAYEGALQELVVAYAEQLGITPEQVMQDQELMKQIEQEAGAVAQQSLIAVQEQAVAEAPVQ